MKNVFRLASLTCLCALLMGPAMAGNAAAGCSHSGHHSHYGKCCYQECRGPAGPYRGWGRPYRGYRSYYTYYQPFPWSPVIYRPLRPWRYSAYRSISVWTPYGGFMGDF